MKLLLLLWWGVAATDLHCNCSCIIMASVNEQAMVPAEEDSLVFMGDNREIIQAAGTDEEDCKCVSATDAPKSRSTSKPAAAICGLCFVCGEPGANVKFGGKCGKYLLHKGECQAAQRCHSRQLKALEVDEQVARAKDKEFLEKVHTNRW